jgi:4-amino-4-deoxy-L-arabinose transferase-like glycosyltransferase
MFFAADSVGTERRRAWVTAIAGLFIFVIALGVFGYDRDAEPLFMDEAAYLSQSFYWDLLRNGRGDDPRWLDYPAYDLPPLSKYLVGASLQAHGVPRPVWMAYLAWYHNPSTESFVTPANLRAARVPSLVMGAIGCVAIFFLGGLGGDRRLGVLSALLLIANPLYRLHARRAMSDVPAESLILAALALGLVLGKHLAEGGRFGLRRAILVVLAGITGGLAVLAKLNGGLCLMTIVLWLAFLGLLRTTTGKTRVIAALSALVLLAASLATFVALNPFVTARPGGSGGLPLMAPVPPRQSIFERLRVVVVHRIDVSLQGQKGFPKDALTTLPDKIAAVSVQGFGRFGPLGPSHSDSTRRFDSIQDRGAVVWLPIVLIGLCVATVSGVRRVREGKVPVTWAFVVQFLLAIIVVGAFLPLAWDRYFLSIQPASCLMGAIALLWVFDSVRARGRAA